MADNVVTIRLRVTNEGVEVLDQAAGKLDKLGQAGQKAAGQQGLGGLFQTFKDVEAGLSVFTRATKGVINFAEGMNELGSKSISARYALDTLSGGKADEYLARASKSTRGLIDDMGLAQYASKALGLHIVSNSQQFADLARAGTVLGQTFRGSASEGFETLTVALTRVGLTGLLDNIGISGERVKNRFEALKTTLGESEGWKVAVLEEARGTVEKLGGSLDVTGTAVQKLGVKLENLKAGFGERLAFGIEGTLNGSEALFNYFFGSPESPGSRAFLENRMTPAQKEVAGAAGMGISSSDYAKIVAANQALSGASLTGRGAIPGLTAGVGAPGSSLTDFMQGFGAVSGVGGGAMGGTAMNYMLGAPDAARARSAAANRMAVMQRLMMPEFELPSAGTLRGADERAFMDLQGGWNAALRVTEQLTAGIRGNMQAGLGTLKELTEQERERASIERKRASIQSVSQAFGLTGDGLYGEIGGEIGGAIGTARSAFIEQQRKRIGGGGGPAAGTAKLRGDLEYEQARLARMQGDKSKDQLDLLNIARQQEKVSGLQRQIQAGGRAGAGGRAYTQKDFESDVAAFDRRARASMDEYALATGAATKESLKFRDAKEQLSTSLAKGTINVDQYTKGMLSLANAAKDSRTSMDELMTVMALTPGLRGKETAEYFGKKIAKTAQAKKLARMEGMDEDITLDALGIGKLGARPGSEFEDTMNSAKKARDMVADLRSQAPTTGLALAGAGAVAAGGLALATSQAANLRRELEQLSTMSINVPVTIGGTNPPPAGGVNPKGTAQTRTTKQPVRPGGAKE